MKIVARRPISEPQDPISRAIYSPDGSVIVGGGGFISTPGVIVVWDTATLERRASFTSSDKTVNLLKFLPDGRTLLTAGYFSDGIESWDIETGHRLARLRILPDPYRMSKFGHLMKKTHIGAETTSADGSLVALGCWDCTLKVVTWATGEIVELPNPEHNNVDFVAFTADEQRLLTGDYERLYEWDAAEGTLQRTIECDPSVAWSHCAIDGGTRVVSLTSKERLLVWDVSDWTCQEYKVPYKRSVAFDLTYSPTHGLLAIGQENGSAVFWDTNKRELAGRLKLADDAMKSLAFAPDRPALCVVHCGTAPQVVEVGYRL